ncbi:hypothetical protein QUF72_08385 [Desulfobacterales bacterium HSG2]|nr:hypothetical protein [Desulfobacterales bacterium HSG2]
MLLAGWWVNAYKNVSEETSDRIKKEVGMEFIATTITEHIQHEAEIRGEIKGRIKGKIEGKIEQLEDIYLQGIISKKQFEAMAEPLRLELAELVEKDQEPGTESRKDH